MKKFKLTKFFKENFKTIIAIIITALLIGGTTAFASYNYFAKDVEYEKNDGTKISVNDALNDLYNNNPKTYIEKKWQLTQSSINYTYTVNEDGIYLVEIIANNWEGKIGQINSGGITIIDKDIIGRRTAKIKLLDLKVGDTININGYTSDGNVANAFIAKLHNINVTEIIYSDISYDGNLNKEYVSDKLNDKILVVAFACGARGTSTSISYNGPYFSTRYNQNDLIIDYARISKGTKATIDSYGYWWGGGSIIIFR